MPTSIGWGVHGWGPGPWGGYVTTDQPPVGDPSRWERVSREPRWKHEPEEIKNVLFKIEGVEAQARVGKATCSIGSGAAIYLRQSWRGQSAVGAVAISTGTGTSVPAVALRMRCECGAVEAGVSVRAEMERGMVAESDVGLAKVRAIRNPTDEELLMMIAEML